MFWAGSAIQHTGQTRAAQGRLACRLVCFRHSVGMWQKNSNVFELIATSINGKGLENAFQKHQDDLPTTRNKEVRAKKKGAAIWAKLMSIYVH